MSDFFEDKRDKQLHTDEPIQTPSKFDYSSSKVAARSKQALKEKVDEDKSKTGIEKQLSFSAADKIEPEDEAPQEELAKPKAKVDKKKSKEDQNVMEEEPEKPQATEAKKNSSQDQAMEEETPKSDSKHGRRRSQSTLEKQFVAEEPMEPEKKLKRGRTKSIEQKGSGLEEIKNPEAEEINQIASIAEDIRKQSVADSKAKGSASKTPSKEITEKPVQGIVEIQPEPAAKTVTVKESPVKNQAADELEKNNKKKNSEKRMDVEENSKTLADVQTKSSEQIATSFPKVVYMNNLFAPPDQEGAEGNKYSLRNWWVTIQANTESPYEERVNLYERALKYLPWCYKLWYHYLLDCIANLEGKCIVSNKYDVISEVFEKALIFMYKMPRIWLMYCEFLINRKLVTKTRQIFNRALMSLPITQHEKIWSLYSEWALNLKDCPRTAKSILKRYLRLNPDFIEQYVEYCKEIEDYDEAALYLTKLLDDESFVSQQGKSRYQFVMDLCDIISKHPSEITSVNCENVIRQGIKKYTDEVGNLYICMADYFVRQGLFERARDAFEEALDNLITARDFGIVFNAYVKFEEEMLNIASERDTTEQRKDKKLMDNINEILELEGDQMIQETEDDEDPEEVELEYKIFRLEKLIERRPLLLNNCLLRQNPNNVNEWIKRVKLVKDDTNLLIKTFGEALTSINPQKSEGKFNEIWIMFAQYYKSNGDIRNANTIYDKATKVNFKYLDELATVWASWVEMHLREGNTEDAFAIIKQALFRRTERHNPENDGKSKSVNELIGVSVKLWSLYLDMEHSFGTLSTIKSAYQRMIDMKIITPQILMNYARYLIEHRYYEEAFKTYEAGIAIMEWPALYDIWLIYLRNFIDRYEGEKLERTRDLFEKVIGTVPSEKKKIFYLMYAEYEERYGLLNHAIEVYDKMVDNIPEAFQEEGFCLYISKVSEFFGITKTRSIFEKAIETLKDQAKVKMGLRFAKLERKLGEIDRARAVFVYLSQYCEPQADTLFLWKNWEDFEIHHGNEETFTEMMKIKRSVMAKYAIQPPTLEQAERQIESEVA